MPRSVRRRMSKSYVYEKQVQNEMISAMETPKQAMFRRFNLLQKSISEQVRIRSRKIVHSSVIYHKSEEEDKSLTPVYFTPRNKKSTNVKSFSSRRHRNRHFISKKNPNME